MTKEEFCGACVALPMALAGAGVAGVGANSGSNKQKRKIMLISGLVVCALSLIVTILYLNRCKQCR
jgi:hypothetical protein